MVKNSGEFERVVSVQRNNFMAGRERRDRRVVESVISDVRDNIRDVDSAVKSYQIVHGGLEEDCLAFVDRNHQWNGLEATGMPPFLVGTDYIMPFNDDKFVSGLELKLTLARPATLYIFLDDNMEAPVWLRDKFTDTGLGIGLDCSRTEWHRNHSLGVGPGNSIDFKFSIWKCGNRTRRDGNVGWIETAEGSDTGLQHVWDRGGGEVGTACGIASRWKNNRQ